MKILLLTFLLCAASQANPTRREAGVPPALDGFEAKNVAYTKQAWQSSVKDYKSCPPPKLTDGDCRSDLTADSCACTLTKKEVNPWVRVNLAEPVKIYYVTVAVRFVVESRKNRDSHIQVRIGNDTDISKNPVCAYLGDTAKQASGFVWCNEPIIGQYVSAQRMNNLRDHMHVCEMRAFTMVPIPVEPPPSREVCFDGMDAGSGSESLERFYFKADECECKKFIYKGEGGNENNFETRRACQSLCVEWEPPARCFEEKDVGTGGGLEIRYYYSPGDNRCSRLRYQGEGGNANRFPTTRKCRITCLRC